MQLLYLAFSGFNKPGLINNTCDVDTNRNIVIFTYVPIYNALQLQVERQSTENTEVKGEIINKNKA